MPFGEFFAYPVMISNEIEEKQPVSRFSLLPAASGRSDTARTCGIVVPNHALYQLSYTPKE